MFSKPNLRSNFALVLITVFCVLAINFESVKLVVGRLVYLQKFSSDCSVGASNNNSDVSDDEARRILDGIPSVYWDIVLDANYSADRELRRACVMTLMEKSRFYPVKIDGIYESDINTKPLPALGILLLVGVAAALAIAIIRYIVYCVFSVSQAMGRFTLVLGVILLTAQLFNFSNSFQPAFNGFALFQSVVLTSGELCLFALALLVGRWVTKGVSSQKD